MSIPASHPLYGVSRRIIRATRYIEEAQKLIDAFGSECEDRILAAYDQSTKQFKIDFPEPSPELPLAISDAVHNLRAALDYLVYELALKDSGSRITARMDAGLMRSTTTSDSGSFVERP